MNEKLMKIWENFIQSFFFEDNFFSIYFPYFEEYQKSNNERIYLYTNERLQLKRKKTMKTNLWMLSFDALLKKKN